MTQDALEEMPTECADELRAVARRECGLLVNESVEGRMSSIIDIQRYSSFGKLILVTAYVLKFIDVLKVRVIVSQSVSEVSKTVKEVTILMDEAESIWIKEVQRQLVEDENFQKWKAQLQLFIDEIGIWRCGGRLANADLPYQTRHPILLHARRTLLHCTHH